MEDFDFDDTAQRPAAEQEFLMENLCVRKGRESGGYEPPAPRTASKRWKPLHEQSIMIRLDEMHVIKKQNAQMSKEAARQIIRKIPVEVLAKEWLSKEDATVDMRAYLVDHVLPTLILGVERLLREVDEKGLSTSNRFEPEFNPINFLAQYLMRNNPRFSNFAEASPYVRGLREVSEEIKQELFTFEDNRLARIKAEARRKRNEREKREQQVREEKERRQEQLIIHFQEWNVPNGSSRLELCRLQNALRCFTEASEQFPDELRESTKLAHPLDPTDDTGQTLSVTEFAQYLSLFVEDMPAERLEQFLLYMSKCAAAHRATVERETRNVILTNLFSLCDHGGIGSLDRGRILNLLEQFWDSIKETQEPRGTLRNPRRWPVVEVDEIDDTMFDAWTEEPDGGLTEKENRIAEQQLEDINKKLEKEIEKSIANDTAAREKWKTEQLSEKSEETGSSGHQLDSRFGPGGSWTPLDSERRELLAKLSVNPEEFTQQLYEDNNANKRSGDVNINSCQRVRNISVNTNIKNQPQMSAFDESALNVSQFVQLVETFLGNHPTYQIFHKLVLIIKQGYQETEEEKTERLLKARKEAISAKRRVMTNHLFEKWDNDGSGYLEMDTVADVMMKFKDGQESDTIRGAALELRKKSKVHDSRLTKQEFRWFIELIVQELPGSEAFDLFVEFLINSVERSYAERIRGEARKKWLHQIVTASRVSGTSLDPVYKAVFQSLYKDAETHGGKKHISASIAMLEKNKIEPSRGDLLLRYAACTPEDCQYMLGKTLFKNMKGISFLAAEHGKPVYVPRVANHGSIYFWNYDRMPDDRDGSFITAPLKDQKKRVFGVLGIDTLTDPSKKAIFITHEMQFFQGVVKAFSIAYHTVDARRKLLRVTESAIAWLQHRCPHIADIVLYLVEPSLVLGKEPVLRKMMTTDRNGDDLFKCMETSETVVTDPFGERHIASPLRDISGKVMGVVDISIGSMKKLPQYENKEAQRMLRLLQQAHREIAEEAEGEDPKCVLEAEDDDNMRMDIMFDRVMLMELRKNISGLDPQSFTDLQMYEEPHRVVVDILRATLAVFRVDAVGEGDLEEWNDIKNYINNDLVHQITTYDPTATTNVTETEKVEKYLKAVPHGEVGKYGSIPAQQLYNWVSVCVSLMEHTRKMREYAETVEGNDKTNRKDEQEEEVTESIEPIV